MNDLLVLNMIEQLTQVRNQTEFSSWVENQLLCGCSASSVLIGFGKMLSEYSMTAHYVSPGFPKSLIKTFDIHDPHLAVPMFDEWRHQRSPVMANLSEETSHDMLWQTMFKQKGYRQVAVAVNMDQRDGSTTYMCLTDLKCYEEDMPLEVFRKHFAIIAPILHSVLSQIEYQTNLEKKDNKIAKLTPRENEILRWIKEGKTNFEISCILGISFSTIKNHVQKILIKLGVNNRTQAIAKSS